MYNILPELHKFRPTCVPFQIATTYAPNIKYHFVLSLMSKCFQNLRNFPLHMSFFFFSVLKLQQHSFKPQFDICDLVTIITWIITKAQNFGYSALYKHLTTCINQLEMYGRWACIYDPSTEYHLVQNSPNKFSGLA
jgi:hypothetical protein